MTTSRKFALISLLVCFVLSTVLGLGIAVSAPRTALAAEKTEVSHYFYNQLGNEQKEFYKAMEEMHTQGLFIEGKDYDLVANGHVTQAQLEAFANGDETILKVMAGARDAFYTDYDEIFYVDFGALSLRVTQEANGKYHAWLGSGRYDTYYVNGFSNAQDVRAAITEYETARDNVVTAALAAEADEAQIKALGKELATQVAQIREAHARIAKATVYRLESTCTKGNEGHVRTPYGVFVKGESLCEGYSRAFKAIMDKLGVPCVLINGGYRHTETQIEEHMWTYVQLLDGNWYAVDQTFDDINGKVMKYGINEVIAEYTEDYFLKGASFMNSHHVTSPYKSAAEYPFTYPELCDANLGTEISEDAYGHFYIEQTPYGGSFESTTIKVSVWISEANDGQGQWCGYDKAAEYGYYIVMRHEGNYLPEKLNNHQDLSHVSDSEKMENTYLVWGYVNPSHMYNGWIHDETNPDGSTYTQIDNESKSSGFEFAVTTIPPLKYEEDKKYDYNDPEIIAQMTTYTGDLTTLVARSGYIQTAYNDEDYQPAPFIVKSTPSIQGKILVGKTYNVEIEYDQVLKLMDGDTKIAASVYGVRADGTILKGTHTIPASVISNVSWESGELGAGGVGLAKPGKITFDFTPSKDFAHDNVLYIFNFNLEGVNSHKRVNSVSYAVANSTGFCSLGVNGYNWRIFGQPQLLENEDLSREGWVDSNGNDVSKTKDRIALVVSTPSQKQTNEMNEMIDKNFDEDVLESFTYNIQLTICKACVIETGQAVRVSIGFPEGFTYNDSLNGVTFKMYHFMHDKQNNIIGVEEIPLTITPLGFIITVKSFSPFALVAAKSDNASATVEKSVIISNNKGGTAVADVEEKDGNTKTLFRVKEGEKRTVSVKANDGFIIESITSNGALFEITNESSMQLQLNYNDLSAQNFVEVNFVAKSVKDAETARGETIVQKQLKRAEITLAKKSVSVKAGKSVELKATVTSYGDSDLYQWYKDGKLLSGQTSTTLKLDNVQTADAGNYTLEVTSTFGTSFITAKSDEIQLTVTGGTTHQLTQVEKVFVIVGASVVGLGALMIIILLIKRKA